MHSHKVKERGGGEGESRGGEFLPDPAPVCDCCCWAARLDVTWGQKGQHGASEWRRATMTVKTGQMERVISGGGRRCDDGKTERVKKNGMKENKEQRPSKTFMHNEFSQAFEDPKWT